MLLSQFTAKKGFVFTLEVLIALIIFSGFILVSSTAKNSTDYSTQLSLKEYTTSVMNFIDKNGSVQEILDSNSLSQEEKMDQIDLFLNSILENNTKYRFELKGFDANAEKCKLDQTFENCFTQMPAFSSRGENIPTDMSSVHEKLYLINQGSSAACEVSAAFSKSPFESKQNNLFFSKPKLSFAQYGDLNVVFGVSTTPSGEVSCDEDIRVDLNIWVDSNNYLYGRQPSNISIILDKSGSMSWDGQLDLTNPLDIKTSNNFVYVADGSSGLRDINIIDPRNPNIVGTYNSPGTASGVSISGNYAYLADGSSGLRIVDISNNASPSSVGSISTIGTAEKVFYDSGYAYVVTTSNGTSQSDITVSGTPTTDNYIGRSAAQSTAAQSFVATSTNISGIDVYVKKTSTPNGNLTVSLRSSISGSDIDSQTISKNNIGSSYAWENITFTNPVNLTIGNTYYIVLSTSSTSSTKYYNWGTVITNPYSSGNSYQNTTSQASNDSFFRTYTTIEKGLQIINVSSPSSPTYVSTIAGNDPNNVFVLGNYAYFTDGTSGLKIIDITNKSSPNIIGTLSLTNASNVVVSGNNAFVADGTSGVRSIDVTTKSAPSILNTYNTPGTATDLVLYSDNNLYVADTSSILSISVSNPSSLVLKKTYPSPYSYTQLGVVNDWIFTIPGYSTSLTSFSIMDGAKMSQMQSSANSFVDFNGWKSEYDKLSLVSFSSSATLDQQLSFADDTNKTIIKNKIDALVSNGGTAIDLALNTATTELTSIRSTNGAIKFEILLTDGQNSSGASPVLTAAQTAKDNNIVIYTIGFGPDADGATLSQVATLTGGTYYSATDVNALSAVFNLIAIDIGESLTGTYNVAAYDANLMIPVSSCDLVLDSNGGSCALFGDINYLYYDMNDLQRQTTWNNYYTYNIPCSSSYSCQNESLTFLPSGTYFYYKDSNLIPKTPIIWDSNVTVNFKYRDLSLDIISAKTEGNNRILLDVNAINQGKLSTPQTLISYYLDDPNTGALLKEDSVNALGAESYELLLNRELNEPGLIYAVINKDNSIPECPGNNVVSIYCSGAPKPKLYAIDLWVWR